MGLDQSDVHQEALDAEAVELVRVHGRKAAQRVVDAMQAALRAGAEAEAMKHERLLRQVEGVLRQPSDHAVSVPTEIRAR